MVMAYPFDNAAFRMESLTRSFNVVPNQYGRIQQLGIFPVKGIATTVAMIESKAGVLNLLPTRPRGGEPTLGTRGKRTVRSFPIPHIPHEDVVKPDEAQSVRPFGQETGLETLAAVMNDKLITIGAKFDITLEWFLAGAIRGTVLDADATVLIDYFSEFNVTEKVVDFDFAVAGKPRISAMAVLRHMRDNLLGDSMTSVRALCSPGFWDLLIEHADVKAAFDRWQDGEFLRQNPLSAFKYAGIEWEEYQGTASDADGNARDFIVDGSARFVPMGTQSTFQLCYAPADFNETVNTIGLPRYAKQVEMEFGRGTKLHAQSNPLPIVTRPALLVEGTIT